MTDPQRSQFLGKEQQKIAVFSHNSKIVNSSKIDTLFLDPKSYTFQLGYLLPFKRLNLTKIISKHLLEQNILSTLQITVLAIAHKLAVLAIT